MSWLDKALFGPPARGGRAVANFASDADLDLTLAANASIMQAKVLVVTATGSPSSGRKLILPLDQQDGEWVIVTTSANPIGLDYLRVGGATGTYAVVPVVKGAEQPYAVARVVTDGTNFYRASRPSIAFVVKKTITGSVALSSDEAQCEVLNFAGAGGGGTAVVSFPAGTPDGIRTVHNPTGVTITVAGNSSGTLAISSGTVRQVKLLADTLTTVS